MAQAPASAQERSSTVMAEVRSERTARYPFSILALLTLSAMCLVGLVSLNTITTKGYQSRFVTAEWLDVAPLALIGGFFLSASRAGMYLRSYLWKVRILAINSIFGLGMWVYIVAGTRTAWAAFIAYLAVVGCLYIMTRRYALHARFSLVALWAPVGLLAALRYIPAAVTPLGHWFELHSAGLLVGISYLCFRLSHLSSLVANRVVDPPSFWEYVGFAFFLPTLAVGPISPYSMYVNSLKSNAAHLMPVVECMLRIATGTVKVLFLGAILNQLSWNGLVLDGNPHHWMDAVIAAVAYHLYLYCNFSGFCDVAIGGAGFLGIRVAENFRNPFVSVNVKEYWNRWHITLGAWMRDMVFSPLSKRLIDWWGLRHSNHAIAAAISIIFLLVGIWHGVGWHFVAYGALQAVAVVTNFYYTAWLKKRLGRDKYKAYNENRWVNGISVVLTFSYTTASLFVFANDLSAISEVLIALSR